MANVTLEQLVSLGLSEEVAKSTLAKIRRAEQPDLKDKVLKVTALKSLNLQTSKFDADGEAQTVKYEARPSRKASTATYRLHGAITTGELNNGYRLISGRVGNRTALLLVTDYELTEDE